MLSGIANSEDPDQTAPSQIQILNGKQCRSRLVLYLETNWSGSTLFAKAGHIQVQQDKGLIIDDSWQYFENFSNFGQVQLIENWPPIYLTLLILAYLQSFYYGIFKTNG